MVKNKKLSKSSVAIIVLALLLIASLVMGMTGAWFTATKHVGDEETLQFGVIKVTPEGGAIEIAQKSAFMPGDTMSVGAVTILNEDEDAYVLYKYQLTLTYDSNGEEAGGIEEIPVANLVIEAEVEEENKHGWLVAGNNQYDPSHGWTWNEFDKNDMLTYNALTYTFNPDAGNVVYDHTNHKYYVLNHGIDEVPDVPVYIDDNMEDGEDYTLVDLVGKDLTLKLEVVVHAIQKRNITEYSVLNDQAGVDGWNETVTALDALPTRVAANNLPVANGVSYSVYAPAQQQQPAEPNNG